MMSDFNNSPMTVGELKEKLSQIIEGNLPKDYQTGEMLYIEVIHLVEDLQATLYNFVQVACPSCRGYGERTYSSTACWRGGVGGQSLTRGTCDKCWGTGRTDEKGTDLRKLEQELAQAKRSGALDFISSKVGAKRAALRPLLVEVANKLDRTRFPKTAANSFWLLRVRDSVVDLLKELGMTDESLPPPERSDSDN